MISLGDKKILVMGLGRLGGGVATTKWLLGQGAKVTVTDLKTRKELAPSIKALGSVAQKIRFVLGAHNEEDFRTHEYVVVNPGVPKESPYLKIAKKAGAKVINDAVLFFEFLPKENPIIAITGTRGKTTTTTWIAHLLKTRWPHVRPAGNTPENPLLKELDRLKKYPGTPAVVELSSWQLEYLPETKRAPDVAVITNFYPDHMNRYASMGEYARAKANIFLHQTKRQVLILNKDNEWTAWFLKQKPKSRIQYASLSALPKEAREFGEHNAWNAALALAAVKTILPTSFLIKTRRALSRLPSIRFRQETILKKNGLCIINDSASTSPEAAIAALERFSAVAHAKRLSLFFIAGGTDKGLSYTKLVSAIRAKRTLFGSWGLPFHLYLLEGSATDKICKNLNMTTRKDLKMTIFKNLRSIVQALRTKRDGIIVFSPGAASFEKFKNEFDRGEQFNKFVKTYVVV
mgnify:CR=1 FL=1